PAACHRPARDVFLRALPALAGRGCGVPTGDAGARASVAERDALAARVDAAFEHDGPVGRAHDRDAVQAAVDAADRDRVAERLERRAMLDDGRALLELERPVRREEM